MAVDLDTFRPNSIGEFADGILGQVVGILGAKFDKFKTEMAGYMADLGKATLTTAKLLSDHTYTIKDADLAVHSQELFMNNVLLRAEFLAYELAQSILETIFKVVKAVIRNFTGVTLDF